MQSLRPLPASAAARGLVLIATIVASVQAGPARAQLPGEVDGLAWCPGGKDCLSWAPAVGADEYRAYRGAAADLAGLLDGTSAPCALGPFDGPTTGAVLDDRPAGGAFHWFLVTAANLAGEGTAGTATGGPRLFAAAGPCDATIPLVLNEVDYDQEGTDVAEFVEIYNPAASPVELGGIVLILVNGLTGLEYDRVDLSQGGSSLPGQGFLVVGSPEVIAGLPAGSLGVPFASSSNALQNGAPDGLALFDLSAGVLLDALSYEGSIVSAQFDGVDGSFDLVEGTPASAVDPGAGSLARLPDGQDTDDADADWSLVDSPSPGATNGPP